MEFKIFTLNCWGIPVISKDRVPRMQAIAKVIATSQHDVVCLQEVWTDSDFNLIRDIVSGTLPYSHYFYSGVIGSGVCILSKYPIQDVFFHQWPVNGYVHKVQHGDWFGGKGIGLCRLTIKGYNINVYSAHLHAEYNRECDEYQAHRVLQAYDTAQFIQLTSGCADLVVLAGDLNTEPGDLAYRIILNVSDFKDAYDETDDVNKATIGTNECSYNSYADKRLVKKCEIGKRIDYVMYHSGPNVKVNVKNYSLPLPSRVPNSNFSYSDHEGVATTLYVEKSNLSTQKKPTDTCSAVLKESIEICESSFSNMKTNRMVYWFVTAILLLLLAASIPFDAPFGYRFIVHILRVLLTLLMCFTFIMGSLWNKIETHGILAGKLAMEINLKNISTANKL